MSHEKIASVATKATYSFASGTAVAGGAEIPISGANSGFFMLF